MKVTKILSLKDFIPSLILFTIPLHSNFKLAFKSQQRISHSIYMHGEIFMNVSKQNEKKRIFHLESVDEF